MRLVSRTKLLTYIFLEGRAVAIIATSLCSKQPVVVEKKHFRWEDFTFYGDIMLQFNLHTKCLAGGFLQFLSILFTGVYRE